MITARHVRDTRHSCSPATSARAGRASSGPRRIRRLGSPWGPGGRAPGQGDVRGRARLSESCGMGLLTAAAPKPLVLLGNASRICFKLHVLNTTQSRRRGCRFGAGAANARSGRRASATRIRLGQQKDTDLTFGGSGTRFRTNPQAPNGRLVHVESRK